MSSEEDESTRISIEPEKQSLLDHHTENHFTAREIVRDIIIGVSDGLTVPFALAAGLSGANASSSIVLTAGVAEVAAGAISMGLEREKERIDSAMSSEEDESTRISIEPEKQSLLDHHTENHFTAREIVRDIIIGVSDGLTVPFALAAGLSGANASSSIVLTAGVAEVAAGAISMGLGGFELGLEKPDPKRALQSAFTIAIAYVLGGFIPLLPYMFIPQAMEAVVASVIITLFALFVFGYAKGHFTGSKPLRSAFETAFIGAIASAAAFGMAKAVQH
ncbi:PREDICTED: vacuolar iron transporter 1-like [Camelina sativa]|uniref:Vacuolar iron transporter n=1 Tax=Camelina sativa TaxID=90675 RepID=A0ABM0YWI3_CAMSA|nr:PREDICTED: vacuolar iron transporter 1-like [Camelina sativa]